MKLNLCTKCHLPKRSFGWHAIYEYPKGSNGPRGKLRGWHSECWEKHVRELKTQKIVDLRNQRIDFWLNALNVS